MTERCTEPQAGQDFDPEGRGGGRERAGAPPAGCAWAAKKPLKRIIATKNGVQRYFHGSLQS